MSDDLKFILKSLNLLYVEDNKRFLNEVENVFNSMFHKTFTASDGVEALEILENETIDIIITDLNMPNMDGMELIKSIREKDKKISIIILTAHADNDLLLEASNLQIDGYITKPINFTKITKALLNATQRVQFQTKYILKDGTIYDYTLKSINHLGVETLLGKKESMLLEYLIGNCEKVVTKEEIIYHIWDMQEITDSALKNLLSNLRNKIGKENIENYPGLGWKVLLSEK